MLKIFIYTILFLTFWSKIEAQATGTDVIILLDNSGSIDSSEYSQMKQSSDLLIERILKCNIRNKVAVVQYYATGSTGNTSKISIESNFTNNYTQATTYSRAGTGNDYLYESVALIGNALDGVSNPNIVSMQTVLDSTLGNNLVIYIFSDGFRNVPGSYLVNFSNPVDTGIPNFNNPAFQIFTNFKIGRGAKFIFTHVSPDPPNSDAAGAAISSLGGAYNGVIESYPNDPDGTGQLPRMYLLKNDFILTSTELDLASNFICDLSNNLVFNFAYEPVCGFLDTHYDITGNLILPSGGNFGSLEILVRDISSLTEYSVNSIPTVTGNQFNFQFDYFDINFPSPPVGQFQIVVRLTYTSGGNSYTVNVLSDYFYNFNYLYELDYNCCPSEISVNWIIASGMDVAYIAGKSVTGTSVISNNSNAVFTAGLFVDLLPGFDAQYGSDFYAYIEGCKIADNKSDKNTFKYRHSNGNNFTSDNKAIPIIKISPNPVSDILNIKTVSKINSVSVTDFTGRNINVKLDNNKIDVSGIPAGSYLISVETKDGISTEKFIKK